MRQKISTLTSRGEDNAGFVLMEFLVLLFVSTLLFASIGQAIAHFAQSTGLMLQKVQENNERAQENFTEIPLIIVAP